MNTTSIQILENQAVDAAIQANWDTAAKINKEIVSIQKRDVQAYLRLGFAYLQLQKYQLAADQYKKVLTIQPQNNIAAEYLEKIQLQKADHKKTAGTTLVLNPDMFMELPGKTKSVTINQLGQKNVLASLTVGEEVFLSVRKRHVEVRSKGEDYVGILPDDVGVRLMYFMENDSEYAVYVQESTLTTVVVFLRERKKGKKVEKMISFPLDIPGSLSRVIAHQHDDREQSKSPTDAKRPPGSSSDSLSPEAAALEEEEAEEDDSDDLDDVLMKELGEQNKSETEASGIETDEEEDEEE